MLQICLCSMEYIRKAASFSTAYICFIVLLEMTPICGIYMPLTHITDIFIKFLI